MFLKLIDLNNILSIEVLNTKNSYILNNNFYFNFPDCICLVDNFDYLFIIFHCTADT